MAKIIDVAECGKSRPSCVVDNDIESSDLLYGIFYQADVVFGYTNVLVDMCQTSSVLSASKKSSRLE